MVVQMGSVQNNCIHSERTTRNQGTSEEAPPLLQEGEEMERGGREQLETQEGLFSSYCSAWLASHMVLRLNGHII